MAPRGGAVAGPERPGDRGAVGLPCHRGLGADALGQELLRRDRGIEAVESDGELVQGASSPCVVADCRRFSDSPEIHIALGGLVETDDQPA